MRKTILAVIVTLIAGASLAQASWRPSTWSIFKKKPAEKKSTAACSDEPMAAAAASGAAKVPGLVFVGPPAPESTIQTVKNEVAVKTPTPAKPVARAGQASVAKPYQYQPGFPVPGTLLWADQAQSSQPVQQAAPRKERRKYWLDLHRSDKQQ